MFVNYFAREERPSPINLAVARVVVSGWLIWKTIMYDWRQFLETPVHVATPEFAWAVPPVAPGPILTVEKWLLIGLLVAFAFGYRIPFTGWCAALLLAHLGTVRMTLITTGETEALFIGVYVLVFFSLFAETDALSVDRLRASGEESIASLRSRLVSGTESHEMPALKWSLVVTALIYFGAGFDKLFHEGLLDGPSLAFVAPENLTRIFVVRDAVYGWHVDLGLTLAEYPAAIAAAAAGTLLLELGFLVAVLAGTSITPLVLGILGFQTGVFLSMGILFVDAYPLLLTFAAWDGAYERLVSDREIDLVFDDRCHFCMRSLSPFALLDIGDTVTFLPQEEAPDRYRRRDDVDFDRAMYVFHGGTAYEGYHAFRELLRQFRVFFWIVWLMQFPVVERIGTRTYRYVADNRGRRFTCRVGADRSAGDVGPLDGEENA